MTTFKTIFEPLSALGPVTWPLFCRDGKQEIHDFRCYLRLSQQVFFFMKFVLVERSYRLPGDKHQKFDYG